MQGDGEARDERCDRNDRIDRNERRVFLEVRDASAVVDDLGSGRALFVPTRLPLALNTQFLLAVRLRSASRAIELPVTVVGRRVPRGGSLLSAGVIVRLADPLSPMFELLRDVAAGRVVDLESRLQEQARVPARAQFMTTAEAACELRALLEAATHFPVDQLVQREDRLALTVASDEEGPLVTVHVLVKGVHVVDGRRGCLAALLPGQAPVVEQFLASSTNKIARA